MKIENIKKMVSIPELLSFWGYHPASRKGDFLHYKSPLREDHNPSFWVNLKTSTCGDFNGDRIGDVINLAARYYNCDIKTAADNLADFFRLGSFSATAVHRDYPTAQAATKTHTSNIHIKHVQPLQNTALLQYVQERGITTDTAKKYLQEVYYKTSDGENAPQYFGVAFRNDKGGYEIRSKYFKGSASPKTVTTFKQCSDTVVVFEGVFTFLSCIEYWNSLNKTIPYDVIVLNSLSNINKADFAHYATIKLMLDADKAGYDATNRLTAQYPNAINITPKFIHYALQSKSYNDFNDYWLKHINGTR